MNLLDDTDLKFKKASEEVLVLKKKPDDRELLILYGLYKQALFGNNKTPKPFLFDFKNCSKWNAWNDLQGMGKNKAKNQYIDYVEILKNKYN
jgi:diazepam-binding inhibitor (GABA receptor modulating acyl-CoA-binding protein)